MDAARIAPRQFPAGPGVPPSRAGTTPRRDAYLDNARYLLMLLVVAGHLWSAAGLGESSGGVRAAHAWVFLFHMPAFILVSGYLSRSFAARPRQVARLVGGVLVPYLIFEALNTAFRSWALGQADVEMNLLEPWYVGWFLIALFCWRLTSPIWQNIRRPFLIAVLISFAAGTVAIDEALALGRVLQFLPFFVLGMLLRPEHLARLRTGRVRLAAVALLAVLLVLGYLVTSRRPVGQWLEWRVSYHELEVSLPQYLLLHALLMAGALLAGFAFLALVPTRTTWFTTLGTRTMYAFLLHPYLVKIAQYEGWLERLRHPAEEAALTVAAVLIATVLMTWPVQWLLRGIVEPRLAWLFPAAAAPPQPAPRRPAPPQPAPPTHGRHRGTTGPTGSARG
ncbi:acyltransferase family protein [Melissospora conviva]|uniref:acyltransferase family protein n=1 Tax=Melissospora conviva TaxID=3388432 RepID=UPI003C1A90E6